VRKLALILSLTLFAAVGATGCNLQLAPYAAIVDGTTISQSQLNQALQKVAADPGYICSALSGAAIPVQGAGAGTYDSRFTRLVLSTLIRVEAAAVAVKREHVAVTSFLTSLVAPQLTEQFGPNSETGCTASGTKVLDALGTSLRHSVVQLGDDLYALQAHADGLSLTLAGVQAYESAHPSVARSACISLIEVATDKLATSLRSEIEHGASFATLAQKDSTSQTASAGGALGCAGELIIPDVLPAQVYTALPATPGTVSAVVSYQGDFYLFEVTSLTPESSHELAVDLIDADPKPIDGILTQLDASASVEIDPAYGTWGGASTPGGLPIIAPAAPPEKFLPNPGAAAAPTPTTPPPASSPQG
jgi:PPIC-type PPIASE domain